jgi:metal-sulfur cluster biosynthetic enzyme
MTASDALTKAQALRDALQEVIDPELGIDIVSLGLVYDIQVIGARAFVTYTLTSIGCPMAGMIANAIELSGRRIEGIERVDAELVFDPPWSPDRLGEDARFALGLL